MNIVNCLDRHMGAGGPDDNAAQANHLVPEIVGQAISAKWSKGSSGPAGDEHHNLVAHTLRAEGFDASEDGTGRGTPIVPIAFDTAQITSGVNRTRVAPGLPASTLNSTARMNPGDGGRSDERMVCDTRIAIRRLTPKECLRLQGFPDDWLNIDGLSDSAKYRMIGNSVAVPCIEWIGRRIVAALTD